MNVDTQREVTAIENNGYYQKGKTLGVGGWGAVYKFAENWGTYHLLDSNRSDDSLMTILARDPQAARAAFGKAFDLRRFDWEIVRETRTFETVLTSEAA